jgi:hypothetical protein
MHSYKAWYFGNTSLTEELRGISMLFMEWFLAIVSNHQTQKLCSHKCPALILPSKHFPKELVAQTMTFAGLSSL